MTTFTESLSTAFTNGARMFPNFACSVDAKVEALYKDAFSTGMTQAELDAAHASISMMVDFLKDAVGGLATVVHAPQPKTLTRVKAKLGMEKRSDRYFKSACDFARLQLVTENVVLPEIVESLCGIISKYATMMNGKFTIRPTYKNEPDLVVFVYIYVPGGYVCEVQIIHPFAAKVFAADSARRDGDATQPDYWANGLYNTVKTCILEGRMTMQQMLAVVAGEMHHDTLAQACDLCVSSGSLTLAQLKTTFTTA